MKCRHCQRRYSAADGQPAPGGSSAPGLLCVFAGMLYLMAALLFVWQVGLWKWLALGLAAFVTLQALIAWGDCRSSGGTCPACGAANHVYPWSL